MTTFCKKKLEKIYICVLGGKYDHWFLEQVLNQKVVGGRIETGHTDKKEKILDFNAPYMNSI